MSTEMTRAAVRYFSENFDMSNEAKPVHPAKPDAGVYRAPRSYADYEGDRQFATTLARGMELLRSFSPASPVLGNKELAEALDLPRATVSRLAYTLQAMGYLAQDQDSGKYRLGAAVLSLGYPLLEAFKLRQRARAGMWELAQQLRGAVAIAIRERLDMIYIEVARGGERGGHTSDIGRTYPIAGTAVGRAHVAACGAQERQYLLNRIQVKTPADWKRHKERLLEAEAEYSRWGCCTSVGDMYPDVQAVAVPLGPMDRGYPAVINVSFQRRKLDQRWLREDVGPKLVALARSLA